MDNILANMVFGHEQAANLLSRAIASQQVPQSLLITGISQVGKTTLARAFAMVLNCQAESVPCTNCPSCRKIEKGVHPDITIFDAIGETLTVEQIRTLQHDLSLRPHEGRYKIAVLCDFERTTLAAANALLKILEEPPAHTILILTAQSAAHLLPTIVSRCQIIHLKPIGDELIKDILQLQWGASAEDANLLSHLATGRLGWAVLALTDPNMLALRRQSLLDLIEITSEGMAFRLEYAHSFIRERRSLDELLNLWLSWWRDVMLIANNAIDGIVNVDLLEKLMLFATNLTLQEVTTAITHICTSLQKLKYNVNQRLNLEVLLLNLPAFQI